MPGLRRTAPTLREMLDRRCIPAAVAIAAGTALAWAYLLAGASMDMPMPGAAGGLTPASWTAGHAAIVLVMWAVMMAAMMLPGAAPMILLHGTIVRKRRGVEGPSMQTIAFAGGYLLAWGGFSLAATGAQWALDRGGLLTAMMAAESELFGAALLVVAGVYQLSPVKQACLRQCRSPLTFLAQNWRDGAGGMLRLGLCHGTYCLGCCWALMTLLFVGGVMNMLWIVGLTVFVLLEKIVPHGRSMARIAGWALIAAGAILLAA